MHWINIDTQQALMQALSESASKPVLIFKHSHRCGISSMALSRLERSWDMDEGSLNTYMVNVVNQRDISNAIADMLNIRHESPQAILLKEGKAVYHRSHGDISYKDILALTQS